MNNLQAEKDQIKLEKLIKRIESLSPEEKQKYIAKLKHEIRLLKANLQDKEEYSDHLLNLPLERNMSNNATNASVLSHISTGAIVGALGAEYFSSEELIVISTILGGVIGFWLSVFDCIAYDKKPVSNKVNKFRDYINEKKIARLEDKIEHKTYLSDQLEEMEN